MLIGERLQAIRKAKKLSQGDIEKRSGLFRCYTSRVENGHTVPSVETLEKFARALEVPLYQLFYDGEKPPKSSDLDPVKETTGGDFRRKNCASGRNCFGCCRALADLGDSFYFTWHRKWHDASLPRGELLLNRRD
jgi:transcriptional regulator with XRE-family HTH domain